jgi:nucleotide-binding universal stress UspA family protein
MTDPRQELLFGDDGSPASDVAWLWINAHRWTGWTLDRCTATTELMAGHPPARDVSHPDRQPFLDAAFVEDRHESVTGDPRVVLSRRTDVELLVVGSHRERSGLRGAWMGSTAWWLMLRPSVPLVVAKHGARTRTVLVGTDGSPHALAAARAFASLPWAADAELHLATVDDGRTSTDSALDATEAALGGLAVAQRHVLSGRPSDVLAGAVESVSADLLVLGTRGLGPIRRWTVGSTASALAYHTDVNLLLACEASMDEDD